MPTFNLLRLVCLSFAILALAACGSGASSSTPTNSGGSGTGSTTCATAATTNAAYACVASSTLMGSINWSLTNAPTGMQIQPASGTIHWFPLSAQAGSYTLHAIASNGSQTQDTPVTVTVAASTTDPVGLFVSPNGNDTQDGGAAHPLLTLLQAVKKVQAGQTIYMRGGEYRNSEYGTAWATRTRSNLALISTSGTASAPITLRPLGNEYVRLVSDVTGISIKSANYWTIQGLEIVGAAPTLGLQTTLSRWWSDSGNSLGGAGIANAGGDYLTVTDCVIHDFPDAGISSNSAEYLTVSNNVVYGNGYWTTGGTHGISVSQMVSTAAGTGQQTIQLTGNVVYANQSLMISHVFSKGFVTLAIDEGNGLHLQDSGSTYKGVAKVANNLLAFNGKAGLGINTMMGVALLNNDFYLNARTVDTGELRLQTSPISSAAGNLFQPRTQRITIDDGDKAYLNIGANATTGTAADGSLYPSVQRVSAVFTNPGAGDFSPAPSVVSTMGVSVADRTRMTAKFVEYGIVPFEPTQVVDNAYLASVKQSIFSSWPATYSSLLLNDPVTGYSYTYAQRCQYPAMPSSTICP